MGKNSDLFQFVDLSYLLPQMCALASTATEGTAVYHDANGILTLKSARSEVFLICLFLGLHFEVSDVINEPTTLQIPRHNQPKSAADYQFYAPHISLCRVAGGLFPLADSQQIIKQMICGSLPEDAKLRLPRNWLSCEASLPPWPPSCRQF